MDLRELEKIQLDCSKRVVLEDRFEKLELVGGMDQPTRLAHNLLQKVRKSG
jgi:deoxyinosine 3'endonuclease (endonuclease V)